MRLRCLTIPVIALLATTALRAQTMGELRGVVHVAPAGDRLSGADLALRRFGADSQVVSRLNSDRDGKFVFTNLAVERYTLSVRRIGYRPVTREISIPLEDNLTVDIGMSQGEMYAQAAERARREFAEKLAVARSRPRHWYCVRDRTLTAEAARSWLWLTEITNDNHGIPTDTSRFLREFRPITNADECRRVARNADSTYGLIRDTVVVFRLGRGYVFPELNALADRVGRIYTIFVEPD